MLIIDLAGFIVAPEADPLEAWIFFLKVTFSILADIAEVFLDC